jgi:wyosine [tRNA(Phe)-imidazoG37] synthetase (radical SAM superfamily)
MKLDAGDQATFEALNRPCPGVRIEQIIDGLTQLVRRCAIVLQTVMVDGPVSNSTGEALDRWIAAVEKIRPASIQVYTSDRPVADSRIRKLDAVKLDEIARLVTGRTGVPARAYY